VPGAFPPLAGRVAEAAATPAGRRYLAAVPQNGLTGEIKIGQVAYRGFMPRQAGIAPADLAAILNYLAALPTAAPKGFKPFTAAEIEALQKESAAMQPTDLAKLRAEVPALSEAPR
jgi:phytoene/squalene synthetase